MAKSCFIIVDFLLLLLLLCLSPGTTAGVVDNVSDGLKLAGQMFGINTAADVANLVAKAFSRATTRNKPDLMGMLQHGFAAQQQDTEEDEAEQTEQTDQAEEETEPENAQETPPVQPQANRRRPLQFNSVQMLSNIMTMIGFDPRKLGALAINAILMIAQAIGSTIVQATRGPNDASTGPEALFEPSEHQPRELSAGDPIDWFMQRPGTHSQRMLRRIMDRELPEHIVDLLASKETPNGNETACMKLLMCKGTPIIWGMQNSLKQRLAGEPAEPDEKDYMNANAFFKYLPSLTEYKEHSVGCEQRFGQQCPRTLNLTEAKNFKRNNSKL